MLRKFLAKAAPSLLVIRHPVQLAGHRWRVPEDNGRGGQAALGDY
jgi:hypothetical protein